MFKRFEGGTIERIIDRYDCWVPPVGYGINVITGELEPTDVIKRSVKKAEQYWERQELPEWWGDKRKAERKRQEFDSDYIDQDCERYREQEWGRRLRGVWVYMNGKAVYLTGLHWFYLNWWKFQGKFMDYRDPNRRFFYVWDYCVEDPNCLGLIEITKRKDGKTARAGCMLYEYISRTCDKHGGIQSKTDTDAEEMYDKAVVQPWQKLPDFYRPVYDISKGDKPGEGIQFFKPSLRGKRALEEIYIQAIESFIDFKPSKVEAYDGPELHRYVSDEAGKMKDVSIRERHNTVMMCSEVDGEFVGKQLYTTTVEEMESGGGEFLRLVKDSDFNERDDNGRTKTGLYVYFLPAFETMFYDRYGMPDVEKGRQYFMNKRIALKNDEKNLQSFIRKNPFTLDECFSTDSDKCLYNAYKLTEREKFLRWNTDITQYGNFVWKDGIKDSEVVWEPSPNGRWEVSWMPPEPKDRNKVQKEGNLFFPRNTHQFISGCDTYDHNSTEDSRNSKAASFVKRRINPLGKDATSKKYVVKYHHRPPMAEMVYEDLIMQCFFFGCQMLAESNKPGVINYFIRRGYGAFLVHIEGYKEPGIPSTQDNKREASLMIESYIEEYIQAMDFTKQIVQLLGFDIKKTEKSDLVMAMLWTEYADNYRYWETEEQKEDLIEIDDIMPQYS
jgi:hypothetical protein